jgi:predicted  nucleic acid-binding Zn-ribbon protein
MSKYDNIPVSNKTKGGMSLTADDQLWLKRIMDRQDECIEQYISETYDKHATLICDTVREMLDEIRKDIKSIHLELKEIKLDIKGINLEIENLRKRVTDHDFRIGHIERKLEI